MIKRECVCLQYVTQLFCWIVCLARCTMDTILSPQEEIAKDLLSGDYEEETQSSADDLTPSVTSHEATDFFPRTLRCK